MRKLLVSLGLAAGILAAGSAIVAADSLPSNWHIHDGQTSLGSQHKGIGFFPRILGLTATQYAADPARCPDATDKAFLPSWGESQADLLRAGVCFTDTATIHIRTVPVGTSGPDGWSSLTTTTESNWVTYYLVTSR
ncbi:MAG: hypothetical protein H0V73_12950 [Chloroflexi bacterium]|nr:hypothetical protein [Chloroflexota bacterium]